jgi:hypothetical protein
MRSPLKKVVHAAVVAGMLCGIAATPAFARHDDRDDWRYRHHHHHYYQSWDHPRAYSYYSYSEPDRYYYPYREYYAPRVYVPPPPVPSFGLNLVFPIH